MPIMRLSRASFVRRSFATKTKPPSIASGISPGGGWPLVGAGWAPPMPLSPLPGFDPRPRPPRPPVSRRSRPRPRPLPPSWGRFWPEGAIWGRALRPSPWVGSGQVGVLSSSWWVTSGRVRGRTGGCSIESGTSASGAVVVWPAPSDRPEKELLSDTAGTLRIGLLEVIFSG